MNIPMLPKCKRCRGRMASVAEIAPIGRDPGLEVFICSDCGTADSVLIYRTEKEQSRLSA
jgi:hypothetical protein